MRNRGLMIGLLVKLGVAVAVSVALLSLVISAIRNPVSGSTTAYSADFTDASGLHPNADVRNRGVQIGKVTDVRIVREHGDSMARVSFRLADPQRLTANTQLAVKYQNLTGIRYLDLSVPDDPGQPTDHLSTDRTRPSFDITKLFNGLQPVLRTLTPDEIDTFTANALALLQGDGTGLAPMLDSIQTLADLVRDRERVISTLIDNMARIDESMGGKSANVIELLRSFSVPISAAMSVLDDFRKTDLYGPRFMAPVDRLLAEIGLERDLDIDKLLQSAFSSLGGAAEALRLLPVAFEGLQVPGLMNNSAGSVTACSHGTAELSSLVGVLLNGSKVTICNAG
ncbi:MCE family protein [Nocardia sp. NBC_00565]|uniref:MlaD family protein n=1 Tax=Nocardia sp. NBC_00565 TaxID=2975993 RepID=UPI002E80DF26|nr:MlaD family protein [Nocardia sp. NBC_00565]WUC05565.1 MCE family protein [Nocardia sp. NBC_00565]